MRTLFLVLVAVAAVAYAAPINSYERPINADCVALTRSDTVSLFPEEYMIVGDESSTNEGYTEVTSAVGFTVDYFPQYKLVTNNIANETYVLYQCGTTPPATEDVPAGAKFFQVPLTSMSAPETVPYAFVELLGMEDRVRDVSAFVTSPCGQKILECGNEGPDAMSLSNSTLVAEAVGPFVDGVLTTAAYEFPKSFAFSASQDPGPLNRAEWVKFLGLFFNRGKFASDVFEGVESEYNAIKTAAAEASKSEGKVPVIAWASHYVYETDASYQLSFAEYKSDLTADAGAAMLNFDEISAIEGVRASEFSPTTLEFAWDGADAGSFATKAEARAAFLKVLQNADAIIDETYVMDPAAYDLAAFEKEYDLTAADAEDLPWLADRLIFRTDGVISATGGLDWFETAIARPDKVLADMARVANAGRGDEFNAEHTWLRTIEEKPDAVSAAECERRVSCEVDPKPICPFVSECSDGSVALLLNDAGQDNSECVYETCGGSGSVVADAIANTAQMAAPAVVLMTVVIVFIEALVNWC